MEAGERMTLSLEITSQNGQALGPGRRKVFGEEGGSIGRAQDCDWVLANPYISRHHAMVRCIGGIYYIESTGENGVAIGSPQAVIPLKERRALKHGDHLFIDEYEVAVALSPEESASPLRGPAALGLVPGDPFGEVLPAAKPPAAADPMEPASEDLDPLKHLPRRAPPAARKSSSTWNDAPAITDHFTPPPVPRGSPAAKISGAAGGAAIPDDWDKTGYNRGEVPAMPQPRRRDAVAAPRAGVAPAAQAGPQLSAFDAPAFLRAAGVDPTTVSPETAGAFGHILRTVVQGVIEVLQARAEVKHQFRLPLTRIKAAENNPLKFAVNAEDALNSLLGPRNAGFLTPVEAFEDAFDDIRFHQMAMIAGMRAAFEHALSRFDPKHLEESFARRAKRGLWQGRKSDYWQLYEQEFQHLAADPDEAFKRLFGEEFASAYEKQLESLKHSGGKLRH
jgi:type VI secretion system protein ImpI